MNQIESDLKAFSADNMDDLMIGVGEITGLDDGHVRMLFEALPRITFPIMVESTGVTAQEKGKGFFRCLALTYPDGKSLRTAYKIEADRFFIAEVSTSDGATCAFISFDQTNIGGDPGKGIGSAGEEWN